MSKHTPGEWTMRPLTNGADVEKIEADGSATLVAAVYGGDSWPANARLIAAAPDLLEACNEVLAWVALATAEGDPYRNPQSIANAKEDLAKLQAAIRKAEGRD